MVALTHGQQLLETRCGRDLGEFLETMGCTHTWRQLSDVILERYGMRISHVSLFRWHRDLTDPTGGLHG
jgi:hypothetical protein